MTKDELQVILEKHKLWLKGNKEGVRADLRGADLSGADLSGADLRDADLRDIDLGNANFRGAYLEGADLSGADLRDVDFEAIMATVRATVISNVKGWHVYFPKGRKDFLSGIADGGAAFYYYEGREDDLASVDYEVGDVRFHNGKTRGFICSGEDYPVWRKEYDWRDRWYDKNYEIGEHNYNTDLKGSDYYV